MRDHTSVGKKQAINSQTSFEDELGVTGDDGVELLEAVERQYGISLEPLRETFSMQPNEFLFHSEGVGIDFIDLGRVLKNMFRETKKPRPIIRDFRVGELFDAICRLKQQPK